MIHGLRPMVWRWFLVAIAVGSVAGLLTAVLSPLREGGPLVWLVLVIWGFVLSCLQFWFSTYGARSPRRLWRGK